MKKLLLAFLLIAVPASAQVGKSLGVADANTATEQVLVCGPEHDRACREGAHRRAPLQQHCRAEQVPAEPEADAGAGESVLRQAFVHVNLNTGRLRRSC